MIIDTHIHIYPCYRLEQALGVFLDRFAGEPAATPPVACLAERFDCAFYHQIREQKAGLSGFALTDEKDGRYLVLQRLADGQSMYLLPGRQVISSENIEVLALCCDTMLDDGLPAAEIIKAVLARESVPVVAWSPGKWFGARGKVVDNLLGHFSPGDFLLGDTSLRPLGWAEPLLMRKAEKLGYRIVHGSDPLPFAGEELRFGYYASRIENGAENQAPDILLRSLPGNSKISITPIGRRSSPLDLFSRLKKNAASKKR